MTVDFKACLGKALKLGHKKAFDAFAKQQGTYRSVKTAGDQMFRLHKDAIRSVHIVASEHGWAWTVSYACTSDMLSLCGFSQEPVQEPV